MHVIVYGGEDYGFMKLMQQNHLIYTAESFMVVSYFYYFTRARVNRLSTYKEKMHLYDFIMCNLLMNFNPHFSKRDKQIIDIIIDVIY